MCLCWCCVPILFIEIYSIYRQSKLAINGQTCVINWLHFFGRIIRYINGLEKSFRRFISNSLSFVWIRCVLTTLGFFSIIVFFLNIKWLNYLILRQIIGVRTIHQNLQQILTKKEQEQLNIEDNFKAFAGNFYSLIVALIR